MSEPSKTLKDAISDLVTANRILGNEGVVDAFGHVSVRHPDRADRYLLSRSRSPSLVTDEDIIEFDIDSNAIDQRGRIIYAERFIHGAIYRARPDVMSVCHSHAHSMIPFTVTDTPIRPLWVLAAPLGKEVPIWDIRDDFPNDDEVMVMHDAAGRSLAKGLGPRTACLMRGHGGVIATSSVKMTVLASIALMQNAEMEMGARILNLSSGKNKINYLSDAEAAKLVTNMSIPRGLHRAWEYWAIRAGRATDSNP